MINLFQKGISMGEKVVSYMKPLFLFMTMKGNTDFRIKKTDFRI